jgi:hypothetical protein
MGAPFVVVNEVCRWTWDIWSVALVGRKLVEVMIAFASA